jgi:hypothetical protein
MSRGAPSVIASILVAALVVFAVVGGIFLVRTEIAWREALARRASGDPEGAVRAARTVFDLYVPGNPRLEQASRLLWDVARERDGGGDREGALEVYRILRSGWIVAHAVGGDPGWVARCEEAIARLSGEAPGAPPGAAKAALADMRAPRRPHGPWGAVAALGFAAWAGSALGLLAFAIRADGTARLRRLFAWGAGLAAGYAAWLLGMMRA